MDRNLLYNYDRICWHIANILPSGYRNSNQYGYIIIQLDSLCTSEILKIEIFALLFILIVENFLGRFRLNSD